jgi:uncharacterized protein (UPF0147 family)
MEPEREKTNSDEAHSSAIKNSSQSVMNDNKSEPGKSVDWWSRADIISKFLSSVVIAVVGLMITWTIQKSQQSSAEAIAKSQIELAKVKAQDDKKIEQGKLTVELLQYLTSKNAAQRKIAIIALQQSLPSDVYENIVQVLASTDPDESVRKAAIKQLRKLDSGNSTKVLDAISQDKNLPADERALASPSTQQAIMGASPASNTLAPTRLISCSAHKYDQVFGCINDAIDEVKKHPERKIYIIGYGSKERTPGAGMRVADSFREQLINGLEKPGIRVNRLLIEAKDGGYHDEAWIEIFVD